MMISYNIITTIAVQTNSYHHRRNHHHLGAISAQSSAMSPKSSITAVNMYSTTSPALYRRDKEGASRSQDGNDVSLGSGKILSLTLLSFPESPPLLMLPFLSLTPSLSLSSLSLSSRSYIPSSLSLSIYLSLSVSHPFLSLISSSPSLIPLCRLLRER